VPRLRCGVAFYVWIEIVVQAVTKRGEVVPKLLSSSSPPLKLSPLFFFFEILGGGYQRTVFSVVAENTPLISPAPQRLLRVTQATRGIACTKLSEEPQVSTFVLRGSLCALRRHLPPVKFF
jgi:hypothetical protein